MNGLYGAQKISAYIMLWSDGVRARGYFFFLKMTRFDDDHFSLVVLIIIIEAVGAYAGS